jgi:hypothetical protein
MGLRNPGDASRRDGRHKRNCLMRMIILSGDPGTGKTTTLNDVFVIIASEINPPPVKTPVGPGKDFEAAVLYKGKRVTIFSEGDTLYHIREAICKYAAQCDVLILAYSDKFKYDYKPGLFDLAQQMAGDVQQCVIQKNANNNADNAAACKDIIANI